MGRPKKGWTIGNRRRPGDPYTVRFTDREGRPREFTTGETNPVRAAERAAEIYAQDQRVGLIVRARVDPLLPTDELMAMWLADLEKTHDPRTVESYKAHAMKLFLPHFGTSMLKLNVPRMADYQRERLTKVLKKTLNKERSTMNSFLEWCVEQGVLSDETRPVWPKVSKKVIGVRSGPQRAEPVDVTKPQVGAFLEALPIWSRSRKDQGKHAVRPRFIVAYETGLRPETLSTFRTPDHWKPGESSMRIEDENDKGRFGRTVPITALAKAALEYVVAELGITEGLIFGDHDYRERVEKARVAAGLPEDFATYDLRHARTGHLLDEPGAEIRAVMFIVGHRLMTTTNKYVRGQADGARQLVQGLDAAAALLPGPGAPAAAAPVADGTEAPARRDRPSSASIGEIPGKDELDAPAADPKYPCAKEGSRTPTSVTPPEPESGARGPIPNSYGGISRQERTQKDTFGQGFREVPETQKPKSVAPPSSKRRPPAGPGTARAEARPQAPDPSETMVSVQRGAAALALEWDVLDEQLEAFAALEALPDDEGES